MMLQKFDQLDNFKHLHYFIKTFLSGQTAVTSLIILTC